MEPIYLRSKAKTKERILVMIYSVDLRWGSTDAIVNIFKPKRREKKTQIVRMYNRGHLYKQYINNQCFEAISKIHAYSLLKESGFFKHLPQEQKKLFEN